jgi:hypothetical protein
MPPMGFEPTIPVGERPQTHALNCAATGTFQFNPYQVFNKVLQKAIEFLVTEKRFIF